MQDVHYYSDDVFTVSEFLTPAECEDHIRLTESIGYGLAPINSIFGPAFRPEIRNNERVMLDDPERAAALWARAKVWAPQRLGQWHTVGLNERFRFYRYDPGQQFNWHQDGAYERANGERSWVTFMVYLNDGFEGGTTTFAFCEVVPKQGTALFFSHELPHCGEPVTAGRKYVLRSDIMYARA